MGLGRPSPASSRSEAWRSPSGGHRRSPHPRVTASTRITTDGAQKGPPLTDGSRLYFGASRLRGVIAGGALAQVAATGGETVELAASGAPAILDIDQDGAELLVTSSIGTGESDLAVMPVLGGTQRRIGGFADQPARVYGNSAAWSPDKSRIVYTIGIGGARREERRQRVSRRSSRRSGLAFAPRWSPDGERVRYSVRDTKTGATALWEANADGTELAPAAPGLEGCGEPLLRHLDPRRPVLRLRGRPDNLWALSRSAISPATPERARAAHLRAPVVLRRDAEPRRQAPLRGGRPAQGQTGPLRRRVRSNSFPTSTNSPPRAWPCRATAAGSPTPRIRRARCGAAARMAASGCS